MTEMTLSTVVTGTEPDIVTHSMVGREGEKERKSKRERIGETEKESDNEIKR